MKFILGQKAGMTRIFDTEGRHIAVTKIAVLPTVVSQIKTKEKDGYEAVQVKALKKSDSKEKTMQVVEFKAAIADYKVGDAVSTEVFETGDKVDITGISKGKGFAGTIKRHGFHRGPASHGGNNVREPGSIGAQQPQRVVKGRKMAGHMGATTITVKNLKIVDFDKDMILVKGAIPGANKTFVKIVSR